MRAYLDNNLLTYLMRHEEGKVRAHVHGETDALVQLIARADVEFLFRREPRRNRKSKE